MTLATISQSTSCDVKAAAVNYADTHRWRVLPVRQKQPLLSKWQHQASADLTTILNWPQWNLADGLGVATGVASGLIVLDVDGPRGEETVASMRRKGLPFPSTWSQVTGRDGGGRHLFFQTDQRLRSRSFKAEGLDIRAEVGYVVAAPSRHPSGRRYESMPNELAACPDWLEEMAGESAEGSIEGLDGIDASGLPERVMRALKTREGNRSEDLFCVYRWALDAGLPQLAVVQLVMANPIGSKAASKSDPIAWLLEDIDRFVAHRVGSVGFTAAHHIELTWEYVATLPSSRQKLIISMQKLAVDRGNKEVTVSMGELAILASMSKSTAKENLQKLIEVDGLLSVVGSVKANRGTLANTYLLRLPPSLAKKGMAKGATQPNATRPTSTVLGGVRERSPQPNAEEPPLDTSHDASRFRALGASWRYLQQLRTPKTRAQLEAELCAKRSTVKKHLARLVEWGLIVNEDYVYRRADDWQARLDQVAAEHGTAGRKEQETRRLAEERRLRREARIRYAQKQHLPFAGFLDLVDPETGEAVLRLHGSALPRDIANASTLSLDAIVLTHETGTYVLRDGHPLIRVDLVPTRHTD
ncbi:bifunctional DNA primase/polymerase [Streptomyces sp. NPDC059568]|uniref:bifunctional DNA primase/polymerase n=1 Tax=Streptomyces sp. NPDC059568 TaxID=3346868 RepID=UPI00369C2803